MEAAEPLRPMTGRSKSVDKGNYTEFRTRARTDGPDEENRIREEFQAVNFDVRPGWCVGDVDFDEDGALFIRNPYLANAIEKQLQRNKSFKMTRDAGFSGPKVNLVC